jgi:hypothetical protein
MTKKMKKAAKAKAPANVASADVDRMSIRAAAAKAGTSEATARRIATKNNLGIVVGGKRTGLTAADVATIKAAARSGPGNPNMKAGTDHQAKAGAGRAKQRAEQREEKQEVRQ